MQDCINLSRFFPHPYHCNRKPTYSIPHYISVYGFLRFHLRNQRIGTSSAVVLDAFVHSQTRRTGTMTTLHLSDDIKINNALHTESRETWGCCARYRTNPVYHPYLTYSGRQAVST